MSERKRLFRDWYVASCAAYNRKLSAQDRALALRLCNEYALRYAALGRVR